MFKNLEKYFLSDNNIIEWHNNIIEYKEREKTVKKEAVKQKKSTIDSSFKPITQKDGLFWCFYYILNGEFAYETLHNEFSTEKLIKIDLVEKIRAHKQLFKPHKIKPNVIENQLLNCQTIDLQSFFSICLINNISFFIYTKNMYYSHIVDANVHVIDYTNNKVKIYNLTNGENLMENIKKTHIEFTSIQKKIKSISNYRMPELITMAKKLHINLVKENGKKKVKKDIYTEISQNI